VTFVHCGQMVARIKITLGMQVGLGHIMLDGDPAPPTPKGHSPHTIFGPYLVRQNGCIDQDATWYGGRPRSTRHCVRCGPGTPRKGAHPPPPNFWPMSNCGQLAVWMKTPLGTEVDLGPSHIVVDGVPAPAKGAQQPPLFGPCLLWPRSPISATAVFLLLV